MVLVSRLTDAYATIGYSTHRCFRTSLDLDTYDDDVPKHGSLNILYNPSSQVRAWVSYCDPVKTPVVVLSGGVHHVKMMGTDIKYTIIGSDAHTRQISSLLSSLEGAGVPTMPMGVPFTPPALLPKIRGWVVASYEDLAIMVKRCYYDAELLRNSCVYCVDTMNELVRFCLTPIVGDNLVVREYERVFINKVSYADTAMLQVALGGAEALSPKLDPVVDGNFAIGGGGILKISTYFQCKSPYELLSTVVGQMRGKCVHPFKAGVPPLALSYVLMMCPVADEVVYRGSRGDIIDHNKFDRNRLGKVIMPRYYGETIH